MSRKPFAMNDTESKSFANELEADFFDDTQDAAEQELERLLLETGGTAQQTHSSLLKKLELYPDGSFPVSCYSLYSDSSWILFKDKYGSVTRVSFEGLLPDVAEFKKSFIYHLIPEYAPFGGIRAYSTTKSHSSAFRILDRYVFQDNHLSGDAESFSFISSQLLIRALDKAKEASAFTHYTYLFHHIRFRLPSCE